MAKELTKMLSTFFYIGDFPVAPGSVASIAGLALAIGLRHNSFLYILVFLIVTAVGIVVSGPMETITGKKDPGCVVIDEVSGMMLGFFLLPLEWPVIIIAYFLFRAFDMFKIYPANVFELQHGGIGIMMDDVVAGLYTCLTMHAALFLKGVFF